MGNTLCPPAGDGRRPPRKDKDKDKDKGKGKDKKHHSSKSKSDKKKSSKSKGKEVDAGAGEEGEIPLQDMPRPGQPREWDSQYYDMNDPGPSALFESARVPLGVPVPPQGQGQYQNYQAEAQDPNLEQERRGRPREAYMSGAADGETQGARVPYRMWTTRSPDPDCIPDETIRMPLSPEELAEQAEWDRQHPEELEAYERNVREQAKAARRDEAEEYRSRQADYYSRQRRLDRADRDEYRRQQRDESRARAEQRRQRAEERRQREERRNERTRFRDLHRDDVLRNFPAGPPENARPAPANWREMADERGHRIFPTHLRQTPVFNCFRYLWPDDYVPRPHVNFGPGNVPVRYWARLGVRRHHLQPHFPRLVHFFDDPPPRGWAGLLDTPNDTDEEEEEEEED